MKSILSSKIIIIVGPTASGKSNLGIRLAKQINGEIISADSRQVYRGLDIGSGKITKTEMRGIPHYCLDIVSPQKIFTAKDFKKYGENAIQQIFKNNNTPIVVGGAGFYIDVLFGRAQTTSVPPNPALRKKLEKKSTTQLFLMLQKFDQNRAKIIDRNNPRRLIRAIEISNFKNLVTKSLSELSDLVTKYDIFWIGVKRTPTELKKRIHDRLIKRLRGIILEVKRLHKQGVSWKRMNELGLEYRFVSMFVQSKITKNEMVRKLEIEIWHYARRQMTWFRRNKEIHWIKSDTEAQKLVKRFLQ